MTNEMFSVSAILTTVIVMTIFALSRKKEDTFQQALGRAGDEMLNEYIRSQIRNKWLKIFLGSLVLSGATFAGMQLMANSNPVIFGGPDGKLGIFDIFSQLGRRVVASRGVSAGNASVLTFGPGDNEPPNLRAFLDFSPADSWGDSLMGALGSGTGGNTAGLTQSSCLTDFRNATTIVADAGAVSGYVYNVVFPDTADVTPGGLCQFLDWSGHTPDSTRYPAWGDTVGFPDSLYMRFTFKLDNDFRLNTTGAKFVGWETPAAGANGLDAYLNHRYTAGNQIQSWRWQAGSGIHQGVWVNDLGGSDQQWAKNTRYDVEILYVAQQAAGDSTAVQKIWINGTLQPKWRIAGGLDSIPYNNLNLFGSGDPERGTIIGFYNFPYYDGGSAQDRNQVDTLFIEGLYFSGSGWDRFNANAVGPNYSEAWGLTKVFTLDPTQADQSVINTYLSDNATVSWSNPGTLPDSGAFFNVAAGDTTTVAFRWASGMGAGRVAGNEINVSNTNWYCETYIRVTFKASSWEYSDNTVKHFFLQQSPSAGTQNTAVGVQTAGNEASSINTTPEFRGTTATTDGVWYDDEFYYSNIGGTSTAKIWRNGVLEADTTGIGTGTIGWNRIYLGPYHGGSTGTKSTANDQWVFSRIVIYAKECGAGGLDMPTYTAGVDSSVYYEDFESYADNTAFRAAYTLGETQGTVSLETSLPLFGSQSGKFALDSATTCTDAKAGVERNISNGLTDSVWVIQYNVRYDNGYAFQGSGSPGLCNSGTESKQFLNIRSLGSQGRVSVLVNNSGGNCPGDAAETPITGKSRWMNAVATDTGQVSICGGATPRYTQHTGQAVSPDSIADGQTHLVTVLMELESAVSSGDGRIRMWVDSVLVMDYDGRAGGNAADTVYTVNGVSRPFADYVIQYPWTYNLGSPKAQSQWRDNVRIWAERGN